MRLDAHDAGLRQGVGRMDAEAAFLVHSAGALAAADADNTARRALEVEIQAFEDEGRRERREVSRGRQGVVGGWGVGDGVAGRG